MQMMSRRFSGIKFEAQSSRKRQIGRIFTPTFVVVRQINPDMDSPLRLSFIVAPVNKMTHRPILRVNQLNSQHDN